MVVDKKEIGTVLPHPVDDPATSGRVQAFDLLKIIPEAGRCEPPRYLNRL
jgi:hypothetical protein